MPIYKWEKILSKGFFVCRAFVNLNLMTSLETYTPQMSPSLKNEADQHSSTREKETTFTHKLEGIQALLLLSFTALLTACCAEVCQGRYVAPVKQEKLLILHDDSISLIEICRFRFSPIKSLWGSWSQIPNCGILLNFWFDIIDRCVCLITSKISNNMLPIITWVAWKLKSLSRLHFSYYARFMINCTCDLLTYFDVCCRDTWKILPSKVSLF